jgi:hypothetical protein
VKGRLALGSYAMLNQHYGMVWLPTPKINKKRSYKYWITLQRWRQAGVMQWERRYICGVEKHVRRKRERRGMRERERKRGECSKIMDKQNTQSRTHPITTVSSQREFYTEVPTVMTQLLDLN